jgi:type VI secretion system protein ImpA
MSAVWDGQALLEPISAEQPCGQNLDEAPVLPGEQTAILSDLDALRLFGQPRSPEALPEVETEEGGREVAKARPPIEWDRVRSDAIRGLQKTKDLRLLGYLATAFLRTDDGLVAFTKTLTTASQWLETYWPQVYPPLDEGDAMARRNALNCFADPMAVVDRLWRLPIVSSRQHGRFSLRDIEIASGQVQPGAKENRPDERAIKEALKEIPTEELTTLQQYVTAATAALTGIDGRMRAEGGPEVAPDFGPLSTQLAKLNRVYREQLASRSDGAVPGEVAVGAVPVVTAAGFTGGAIQSRQDAVRALDAVAEYFRRNEPSSPIPLFVERAKRLVAKDFLEVLADIAPDALVVARSAGGLKPDE